MATKTRVHGRRGKFAGFVDTIDAKTGKRVSRSFEQKDIEQAIAEKAPKSETKTSGGGNTGAGASGQSQEG